MRALPFLLTQLKRTRIRYPLPHPLAHRRLLHVSPPSDPQPLSQILDPSPDRIPRPEPPPESEADASTNEFLSRFVHAIRPILSQSFPDLSKKTLDSMLLLICQRVAAEIDGSDQGPGVADFSEDLWKAIHGVSQQVHEAMRRERMREELRKYLHHEDVKHMCRFASEVGVRGDMLREFRFKWARERMEEEEFYRNLEKMREDAEKEGGEEETSVKVEALPVRKGKIKYKIHGLDLSDPVWAEVTERAQDAARKFIKDEAKPVVGRSKRVEDKFFGLDWKKDDLMPVLKEWDESLEARRVDWLALLERIRERDEDFYFKVAELLLTEEAFEPNICDYSRLIDAHSKADRIEDAQRILTKMTENGIEPDILTHSILLHMYSKSGNVDEAKNSFKSLKKEGFKPDVKAYTSMAMAYIKAGLPNQAETLTREMEKKDDLKPTREIYTELLRAYSELGQVDAAQRILNTMQFSGIQPTMECSTLLVQAYGRYGDPDQARVHFDHMMKAGHTPDDRCTASMMMAYAKKNLLDKALHLLLTLKKDGFTPGVATNTVLVDWLGRLQLVEEAELVLEEIKEMGGTPFEIHVSLCDMYSRAGNEAKAKKSLKILEGRKKLLSADQLERIVSGLVAGGFVNEAKRMYDSMQALGFKPSEHVSVALMASQSFSRHRPGPMR